MWPTGTRSRRRGARPSLVRWQPIQNALANHTQLAGLRLRQTVENELTNVLDVRGSYPLQLSISRAGQSCHRVPTVLRVGLPRYPVVLLQAADCLGQPRKGAAGEGGEHAHPERRPWRLGQAGHHQVLEVADAELTL